ncbi:MAG: hypothetical protein BMS9Abin15_1204 [Gammaproteobacteria bacterium]|nr:MAG: hypothetical protein BMS9Abin15_1204 [Gammaproteobacteria bacterium]
MPLLTIHTNNKISDEQKTELLSKVSSLVAKQLGKPERYVMVRLADNEPMLFAGDDKPLAFLELKSIGLSGDATADLSSVLCGFMKNELNIPTDRTYIEFSDAPRKFWGWNSGTF